MSAWPAGYGLHMLDEVDSTLNEAARLAPTAGGPVWILARRQSQARGRRGRAWSSQDGNLAATLLMQSRGTIAQSALRSYVAALALYDTATTLTGRAEVFSLKWPNDVLLNGGKLAGILLESIGSGDGAGHLAIGIGVNLATAPSADAVEERALRPVSLLSETGVSIAPDEFLTHLAVAFAKYEDQFITYGFEPIRTAWLRHAARLGEVITARTGTTETAGRFETVDSGGNLILGTAKGRVAIPAAEIYF